jgi:hypothetical protein
MCNMLLKLVLYNYMFATYVNNYILQLLVSGQIWELSQVLHDNILCGETCLYKSYRKFMYLAAIKIFCHLAK